MRCIVIIFLAILFLPLPAEAAEFYAGTGLNYSYTSDMKLEGKADDNLEREYGRISNSGGHNPMSAEKQSIGGRLFVGGENKEMGLELGVVHLGTWEIDVSVPGSAETQINALYSHTFYRVTDSLDCYFGIHYNHTKIVVDERVNHKRNKQEYRDSCFGELVGLRYRAKRFWVGLEYWNNIGQKSTVGNFSSVVGYVAIPFRW